MDGEGIKDKLTNVAEGLKAMGQSGVTKGALNLIPTGIGFMALLPGLPAMFLLSKMDLSTLGVGLTEMAIGLEAMSGTFMGALALAAVGLGFAILTLGIPAMFAVATIGGLS